VTPGGWFRSPFVDVASVLRVTMNA